MFKKYIAGLFMMFAFASMSLASEPLRIGVDANLKPFVYVESDGQIKGFDVDVANAVCHELKRECVFVNTAWDGLIPSLRSKKIDVIISSMSITEDRDKVVDFSVPYYKSPSQFMVSKKLTSLPESATIGVLFGSTDENYAKDKFGPLGHKVQTYTNQNEAFLDMISGRIQAVLGPQIELSAGLIETPQGSDFHFVGDLYDDVAYYGPGIGMAVREGDDLKQQLDQAIKTLRKSGEWQKISDNYFTIDIWAY